MKSGALFGRYWEADSIIHRLDPRAKIAGTFIFIVTIFCAWNFPALGMLAVCTIAFFALARIPLLQALRSIAPLSFIIVLTALFNLLYIQGGETYVDWGLIRISEEGVRQALFIAVRLTLLLLSGSLLTLTTTTLDITEALERLLAPLARIGVPAHEFSLVLGIALRFLPQFAEEFRTIRAAQLARGAKLATSPVRGGLSGRCSRAPSATPTRSRRPWTPAATTVQTAARASTRCTSSAAMLWPSSCSPRSSRSR